MDIQTFRRERGLTQQDFGKLLGVTGATVSRWESGAIGLTLAQAAKIEAVTEGRVSMRALAQQAQAEPAPADAELARVAARLSEYHGTPAKPGEAA